MTDAVARRIVLAMSPGGYFGIAYDTAHAMAKGEPVQEDMGFSVSEVMLAKEDRAAIRDRYEALKGTRSFLAADIAARLEWLTGLADAIGDENATLVR